MKIEQLYTGCLSEAAYYIESNGEAAIIDPLRETEPYLEKAKADGAKIKYVFETHFHADFVSGHIDLAKKSGAKIVFGPNAETGYDAHIAEDGEEFKVGSITIRVLHTPGHTLESSTFLLIDEHGKEHAIFTGDTLFIGDVGRPDLAVKSDLTEKDLAGMLYDSLRNRIMPLPDHITVYPAHGAGSACGKNMSSETFDTLGNQKKSNYALNPDMSKEDFIKELTDGILPPPQYFPKNAMLNKTGYESVDVVLEKGANALSVEEVKKAQKEGALILDTRGKDAFKAGFIPGSIFIGLDGSFAVWVGTVIEDLNQPIVVVSEDRDEEAVLRLARVGYDNCVGYLDGGFESWKSAGEPVDSIPQLDPANITSEKSKTSGVVLDVRKPSEYEAEHVEDAQSFPLDFINGSLNQLDKDKEYLVHCKSGYRSVIAASIMKRNGFNKLQDITGGMQAILNTDTPVTAYVCPNS